MRNETTTYSKQLIQLQKHKVHSNTCKRLVFLTAQKGGIYFAYMFATATYANGEGTVGYSPTTVSRSIPFNEELNKFDYGARLGAVYTNGGKFLFDANLSYGIPSIFKKSYETIDYSINNFYFQFSVMYNFSKGLSID